MGFHVMADCFNELYLYSLALLRHVAFDPQTFGFDVAGQKIVDVFKV